MKTNTTTNEKELNTVIYLQLADIAREVFNHINAEEGKTYTAADIARAITGGPVVIMRNRTDYELQRVDRYELGGGLTWAEGYDPATVYEVAAGSFSCRVNGWKIWNVLDNAARAWSIATALRAKFTKTRAAAPVVASFVVSKTTARELLAAVADDILRPVMCHVHFDPARRVLVASDGHIMRVVRLAADDITTTAEAAAFYNVPASVFKTSRRHITVKITADGYATADDLAETAAPCCPDVYPNWAAVIEGTKYAEAGRVELTPAQWNDLKKAVAEVAKVVHNCGKYDMPRVTIAHETGADVLHVYAIDRDFEKERDAVVNIDPAAPVFSIDTDARRWAKLAPASSFYVVSDCRAITTTDPAGLTLVMPLQPCEDDRYFAPFKIAPAENETPADLLPGVDLAAVAYEINHARHLAAAVSILNNGTDDTTAADLAETLARQFAHTITNEHAAEVLAEAVALVERDEYINRIAAELLTITGASPAADTLESETPAEAENVAENVAEVAAPTDTPQADREAVSEAENERETPQADTTTAAPAADVESETPAPVFTWSPELRAAAEAVAPSYIEKNANDPDTDRRAYAAARELRAAGLAVAGGVIKIMSTGETVAKIRLTYGKKRRDLSRPVIAARVEYIEAETITPTPDPVSVENVAAPTDTPPDTIEGHSEAEGVPRSPPPCWHHLTT